MKMEKLKAKLAKYEEAYRAARREYGTALAAEITRMHASDLPEEKVRKIRSKGKRRGNDTVDLAGGPKAQSSRAVAVTTTKATVTHTASKRGPGRPKLTIDQRAAASMARSERAAILATKGELGSLAASVVL